MAENINIDLTTVATIENVDFAIYDWLDKELNIFCSTKDGSKKVPTLWVTPERAYQVKNNREFRDFGGAINPPLVTIERMSYEKDQKNAATYYANRINQKKTSEFANADFKRKFGEVGFLSPRKNKKIVYQYKSMLLPVYVFVTYSINIFTQFQQQMNEIIQPFLTRTGSRNYFLIERDGYKYECFIQPNIETKNNISSMEEEERKYLSTITIKVLANIISDGANEKDSIVKTFENPVEVKLPKEGIIVSLREQEDDTKKNILLPSEFEGTKIAVKKTFQFGNGVDSVYVITHGLNTRDLYVSVRENFGDFARVEAAIGFQNLNSIEIDMGDPVLVANSYVVTLIG